ncbi:hypothetical protein HBI80_096020 [Parastagonospora nodorum]|nr:hypothetical protein HBH75_043270 [Parastagonospora nodorum]KAH4905169.1 hypothetical protein HBI80_096020 [Parastagonospora nodorum]KAH5337739.1 hypothetical protein HBI12_019980 [Parastagonospora nodorum]KAH5446686.1 hypothetical protein HBI47_019730 [Parastagonospora nodorum]KAH6311823.1 hypothetical protein HBI39_063680 [Parastagonospora nodorum]
MHIRLSIPIIYFPITCQPFAYHMSFANYLPDELLLEILEYVEAWETHARQESLARFCCVSRQWYDVGIRKLYESPYLSGRAYERFVRTICPSVIPRIRPSSLAGLVRVLDLSHIVHNSNKATTARLLGRTKNSLQTFIAPQASFAINCWASLSKCIHMRVLDLSLVSEAISFQSLNQTIRQLPELRELYLPRCNSSYEAKESAMNVRWPPILQHLSLSGSVSGQFLWDMLRSPDNFPPTLASISILHCPGLDHKGVRPLLQNLASALTVVELRDLPAVKHGRFNGVLDWCPNLHSLSVALDYIDARFGNVPDDWNAGRWREAKPLQTLTLVSSGQTSIDPNRSFTAVELWALLDERFLGRLRYLHIAQSTEWHLGDEGAEVGALELLLTDQLDKESWELRRWHYADLPPVREGMTYERWIRETSMGQRMRPHVRMLRNR